MSKQLDKLLVLSGFGLRLFISGIHIFISLFRISFHSAFVPNLLNFTSTCAIAMIAAGFGIMFLAEHNILDLVIAGGFAINLLTPVLSGIIDARIYNVTRASAHNPLSIFYLLIYLIGLLAFSSLPFLAWAFKLFRKSNLLAAFAIIGAFAISVFSNMFFSFSALPIIRLIHFILSFGSNVILAFVAFIEFNSD